MQTVLVTGGAGYIGSQAVRQLIKSGYQPIVVDNLSTGFRESVPQNLPFIQADILQTEALTQVMREYKISCVMHFAALMSVPESVEQPLRYYENNVSGSISLLKACEAAQVHQFIFSSTCALYGDHARSPVDEKAPTLPMSPYAQSKLMIEQTLADYGKKNSKFHYVALRYFNVAGASVDGENGLCKQNSTGLFKLVTEAATQKKPSVQVTGIDYPTQDGTGVRDYIHIEDLVDAHILALEYLQKNQKSNIFNLGYGHGYSVREVIQAMKKVSGVDFKVIETDRRPGDIASIYANPEKAKTQLGWKPQYDNLELICKTAYEWEKKLN